MKMKSENVANYLAGAMLCAVGLIIGHWGGASYPPVFGVGGVVAAGFVMQAQNEETGNGSMRSRQVWFEVILGGNIFMTLYAIMR